MQLRVRLLGRLATVLLLTSNVAIGQAAPDCAEQDATVCGRKHFETGTAAFEKGDFVTATAEFQAALAQRPHAVIRFNLALSLARLGRPRAALEQLQQVLADPGTDRELRARAEREQRGAEQALSRVSFRLSDPTRERVELDGAIIQLSGEPELALDPGSHHVRIFSNGLVVLDQELELSPGERVELRVGERSRRIDVVVVPEPATVAPPAAPVAKAPSTILPGARLTPAWFYAGASATAVFTGLTVWSGLNTKSAYSDYQRDLPQLSQPQAADRVSAGHAMERRTNLLLAGSLLCGAGTAVLGIWFTDFTGKPRASVGLSHDAVVLSGRF